MGETGEDALTLARRGATMPGEVATTETIQAARRLTIVCNSMISGETTKAFPPEGLLILR
jgi:hypothetical protein